MKSLLLFVLGALFGLSISSLVRNGFEWSELFAFLVVSAVVFPVMYIVNRKKD